MRCSWITGMLMALALLRVTAGAPKTAPSERRPAERHLIICLDGVGYDAMKEMQAEGHFPYLRNISHMIAPFPSITNHSLAAILEPYGAPKSVGYEDLYYDRNGHRTRGGLGGMLRGENPIQDSFWQTFHSPPSLSGMVLGYMLPPISCTLHGRAEIAQLRKQFLNAPQPTYLAYISGTDSVAHTAGRPELKSLLRVLDKTLSDIHARDPHVKISLFSDHGNPFMPYKHISFDRRLKAAGFRPAKKISDTAHLVRPLYSLVGSAVFYSREQKKRALAEALVRQEGVDFACFQEGNTVHLANAAGRAQVMYADGRFAYQPETADPLALGPIMEKMKADGRMDDAGWAEDQVWFMATQAHIYPDPLHRVWAAFGSYVANPASVIVSLKDGYYAGSPFLDLFVRLRATHGNLRRGQSLGFAASTAHVLPEYLRAEDVWPALNR